MTDAAGIWLEDWRRGILWACAGYATKRTSGQYIAPSWSWGSLEFERSSVEAYWATYQTHQFSSWWYSYERIITPMGAKVLDSTAILLDCKIETMDGDVYGRISSGMLSLRSRTLPLSSSLQNTYAYYIEGPGSRDETSSGLIEGKEKASSDALRQLPYWLSFLIDSFPPDFSMPPDKFDDLLVMDISRMRRRGIDCISECQWALALRPVPESRFYERVGVMNFECDSCFSTEEAWEVRDIDII